MIQTLNACVPDQQRNKSAGCTVDAIWTANRSPTNTPTRCVTPIKHVPSRSPYPVRSNLCQRSYFCMVRSCKETLHRSLRIRIGDVLVMQHEAILDLSRTCAAAWAKDKKVWTQACVPKTRPEACVRQGEFHSFAPRQPDVGLHTPVEGSVHPTRCRPLRRPEVFRYFPVPHLATAKHTSLPPNGTSPVRSRMPSSMSVAISASLPDTVTMVT